VANTYNEILFSLKEEGNSNTWMNIMKEANVEEQILYDFTYLTYLEQTKSIQLEVIRELGGWTQ
jgi:hypothetical protein